MIDLHRFGLVVMERRRLRWKNWPRRKAFVFRTLPPHSCVKIRIMYKLIQLKSEVPVIASPSDILEE